MDENMLNWLEGLKSKPVGLHCGCTLGAAWQLAVLKQTKSLGSLFRSKRGAVSGDGEALHRAGLSRGKSSAALLRLSLR